jgi:hypothetical protein
MQEKDIKEILLNHSSRDAAKIIENNIKEEIGGLIKSIAIHIPSNYTPIGNSKEEKNKMLLKALGDYHKVINEIERIIEEYDIDI